MTPPRPPHSLLTLVLAAAVGATVPAIVLHVVPRAGAGGGDVVRARAFELLDDHGKVRAKLGTGSKGSVGLSVFDEAGMVRTSLTVDSAGRPELILYDNAGRSRSRIGLDSDGSSALMFIDSKGRSRVLLTSFETGTTELSLTDPNGVPRAGLAAKGYGDFGGLIGLSDAEGHKLVLEP